MQPHFRQSKITELQSNIQLNQILLDIGDVKKRLSEIAKLSLEYQHVIIKTIIRADQVENLELHLAAIQKALPIFAASRHFE